MKQAQDDVKNQTSEFLTYASEVRYLNIYLCKLSRTKSLLIMSFVMLNLAMYEWVCLTSEQLSLICIIIMLQFYKKAQI